MSSTQLSHRDRLAGASLGLLMLTVVAACTGSSSTAAPSTSTTSAPVITAPPLPDIDVPPNPPVGLVVVNTADSAIELAWDRSRDGSVDSYEVTRVSPAGSTEHITVNGPSYVDSGLDDGDIYTYRVIAVGPGGSSSGSDSVTAQVGVDSNPPKHPGRPAVVESDMGTVLTWAPVADISGIDHYVVTRTIGTTVVEFDNGPSTTFTDGSDSGLVATYAVHAVDGAENVSEQGRSITLLTGSASDKIIIVVSAESDPAATPETARLQRELLGAGYTMSWFEDGTFDSNITTSDDVVLLLGDVKGEGFDWNVFGTDATVIGLKSMFVQAGGITENPPKLDRLAQLDYLPPGGQSREVVHTATDEPKPVVYLPENELFPSLEVWARPVWSDTIAVAGLIHKGDELANEKPAPGCRAFFPGSTASLSEQSDAGWALLVEFVGQVADTCG